jgi:hypothetical protein
MSKPSSAAQRCLAGGVIPRSQAPFNIPARYPLLDVVLADGKDDAPDPDGEAIDGRLERATHNAPDRLPRGLEIPRCQGCRPSRPGRARRTAGVRKR